MQTLTALCRSAVTVEPGATLASAATLMDRANVGCLVVVDDGHPVGVVTDRDMVRRGLAARMAADGRVDAVMSMPLVTVDATADLSEVIATFGSHPIRRVVVVDGDNLVGVLSVDDLLTRAAADLSALVRPITAEAQFGHHEAAVPVRAG